MLNDYVAETCLYVNDYVPKRYNIKLSVTTDINTTDTTTDDAADDCSGSGAGYTTLTAGTDEITVETTYDKDNGKMSNKVSLN